MRSWPRVLRRHPLVWVVVGVLVAYSIALAVWTSGGVDGAPTRAVSVDPLSAASGPPAAVTSSPGPEATAGPQTVTFRATGTSSAVGVSYAVGSRRVNVGAVQVPFARREVVKATQRLAMTVEVAPSGGTATCTIVINGSVAVRQTATGPYAVTACVV